MKNLVVGITGGIGTGKSTVCRYIKDKGYPVISADAVAKDIMNAEADVSKSLTAQFGADIYKNGKLDAKLLAEKVFNDKNKIKILNSIVHPPTIRSIKLKIKEFQNSHSLIFVEAALIFEASMDSLFDYVLLVTSDDETRIKRVLERGTESKTDIKNRMSHQLSEDSKRKLSDFVLENNSDLKMLEEKTLFFLNLLKI